MLNRMTEQVVDYKIAIGDWVKRRLVQMPGVMKIPANGLDIFVKRDFLTPDECDGLIRLIDPECFPSELLSSAPDPDFRTSQSCNMRAEDPLVSAIEAKLNGLMGIQPENGEIFQGQRYQVGQQFKPHHDFFHASEPYWQHMMRCGGQRTWTAMVFLNVPEGGGQTEFVEAGIKVTPRTGNLLTWNNLDALGNPNPLSMHSGCPVTAGVKYVITKWYRERPWILTDVRTY